MLYIANGISIDESELKEEFVRASGPGGQHVNKTSSAVQLRFNVVHSPSLPEDVRARVCQLAAGRLTGEGELIIEAKRFRSQEQNRRDARARLTELLRRATVKPRKRRPTKPTMAARERRLGAKQHRGKVKRERRPGGNDE
jgi:ribosome-associated protein